MAAFPVGAGGTGQPLRPAHPTIGRDRVAGNKEDWEIKHPLGHLILRTT